MMSELLLLNDLYVQSPLCVRFQQNVNFTGIMTPGKTPDVRTTGGTFWSLYGDGHDRIPVLLLSCTAEFLDECWMLLRYVGPYRQRHESLNILHFSKVQTNCTEEKSRDAVSQLNKTFKQFIISSFTNKDTNVLVFFLNSLTTVRAFSFQSSITSSDIFLS